jgi:PKD repeat protein
MKSISTKTVIYLFLLFSTTVLSAQATLWPGDANDNGRVNGIDLLMWSYGFNTEGRVRPGASINWVAQPMGTAWNDTFPDGTNLAYADFDGNALIAMQDFKFFLLNRNRVRPNHQGPFLNEPYVQPDTSDNHDAVLRLLPAGVRLTAEGSSLLIDVELFGRDSSFADFHGLSFIAELVPGQFRDHLVQGLETIDLTSSIGANRMTHFVEADSANHQLRFTITDLGDESRAVGGTLLRLELPLADVSERPDTALHIRVTQLVLFDKSMKTYAVATPSPPMADPADCAFTVNPVCGNNGITYLNSCFAEAAGVTTYTAGPCWSPGIVVANMNPTINCGAYYEPVCGFNGVTYQNACAAEAAGVVDYFTGVCQMGAPTCYDPALIIISRGTSLSQTTGVLILICTASYEPVCGCDAQQYANACLAEASGIRNYTVGGCDADCIDPDNITSTDDCGNVRDFVCGCNDETYINACYADAAGILSYTNGPCNGTSGWCEEATVISCGDYLPNESTIGTGNQLTNYPGATNLLMQGPDRVYVFEKTSAGDLQVGLEIMTPGLNMDIFLLRGDCGNYTVVGSSTTSNNTTNNEGIVLNDAPNGTYYIVVDQHAAGLGGNYRLELSCGYLDCSQRVPLSCGVPYNGSNAGGADDVSTYTCGPTLNVENNGPEIVHRFTTTEAGLVTIDLTGLSANLELFLLSECSRRSGLAFSQNSGTASERIVRNLPAGTYYIVVDGYNGAISDYRLTVDCSADCAMTANILQQTTTACGQSGGSLTFQVTGGHPTYTAHYVGPVCRTVSSNNGHFYFQHLPAGTYTTFMEDRNGCELTFTFTIIGGEGSMSGIFTPTDAGCGEDGRIDVQMTSAGIAPYTVFLTGDLTRTFTTNSVNFGITPLNPGHYNVRVLDATGCSMSGNVTVGTAAGNLAVNAWGEDAGCDGTLGEIVVRAPDGTLPYTLHLSGPVNGSNLVNGYNFRVRRLPAGQYTLTLTDAFGCSFTDHIVIGSGSLEVDISATPANCSVPGAARVNIAAGRAPYMINYNGPVSGTITTSESITIINNLPAGTYNFAIWSDDGCDVAETIFIEDNGGALDLTLTQQLAACDGSDTELQLVINGGSGPYSVTYSGTVNGGITINGTGVGTLSLPAGAYSFTVRDFGNCSVTTEVTITGSLTPNSQSSFLFGSGCGQQNNIRTSMGAGELPYQVTVVSDACPEQNISFTALNTIFDVFGLPNCTYTINVTDANGCFSSREVVVNVDPNTDFLELTALDGACGGLGAVDIEVTAGQHPYFITYTGPVSGGINIVGREARVSNLPAGTYVFQLTNRDGCTATESITLLNDGSLEIISSIVTDDCGAADQIWNDIEGGVIPYSVTVTRLCDNTEVEIVREGLAGFEIVDLEPCCYKLVVTDANGCMTMKTVCIPAYQLFNTLVTDALCGQPGSIQVMVMNEASTGPYVISYTGPRLGSIMDADGQLLLEELPAGNYTIRVTDINGCSETESVTIDDIPSDLDLQTALIFNDCGQLNQLWSDINGGNGPFDVIVTRLCDNTIDTTFVVTGNGFDLTDLDECCYEIKITDANGCMVSTINCVEGDIPDLVDITPVSGPCGQNGRINLNFVQGTSPYVVVYTGPQSGDNTVNGNQLSINDAPAGDYTFTITDANGCTETEQVTLEASTNDLVLNAALIFNECGQYNQIWIDILNGTGPFNIEVIRLCDGTILTEFVSGEVGFELYDLAPCDYKIIVTDAAGCMVMNVVTVFPAPIDLFDFTATSGECDDPALFNLDITGGRAPYTIVLEGPVSDSIVTNATNYNRSDLPSGDYIVFVTDSIGCVETGQFTLNNTTTDLDLVTSLIFNECGQLNQLWSDINGGVGPFDIVVTRLCDGTIDTTFTTTEREFELYNRPPCNYKLKVTDATGCMDVEMTPIAATSANLFDLRVDNSCDSSGFYLHFVAGSAPYRIVITGPVTEQFLNVMDDMFLPASTGDYSVRAWSAEGCSEMSFSSISGNGDGELPEIAFTANLNGLSATFENASGPGTYRWDFGDGSAPSTNEKPVHTYPAAATYEVCLTVANGCGANTNCQNVTVSAGANAQIVIGSARTFPGNTVRIPVSVQGVTNVSTIAGTFALSNPNVATITHLSRGALEPQFNASNGSFSFVASGTAGVNLTDPNVNVLFFLHLTLGNGTGMADITLIGQPLQLEMSSVIGGVPLLVPVSYLLGSVESSVNLLGHISSRAMTTTGNEVDQITFQLSEPDGSYVIDLPENTEGIASTLAALTIGRMYYVEPVKTTDYRNGLSSFEAFLTQRYLLGYEVPQITHPMQVVAMDMNCSQSLSTLDIYLMQRLLLEDNLDEIPGCNSWSFVPDTHEFPADWSGQNAFPAPRRAEVVLETDTMVMFTAVKTGDLLNNADPGRSSLELPLTVMLPEVFEAGRTYLLQLSLGQAADLVAIQGEITLADGLDLIEVTAKLEGLQLGRAPREPGVTRFSWISEDGNMRALHAGAGMVEMAVRASRTMVATTEMVRFTNSQTFRAEAHDANYQRMTPVIGELVGNNEVAAFRLVGAAPNPAADYVDIRFELPATSDAELLLLDALGRRLLSRRQMMAAGPQRFRLDTRSLAAGAYHYQLRASGEVVTGKLVIRR